MSLRHPGSNRPDAAPTGNHQYIDRGSVVGSGAMRSCWDCKNHRPMQSGRKVKRHGWLVWCCNDCIAAREARIAARSAK